MSDEAKDVMTNHANQDKKEFYDRVFKDKDPLDILEYLKIYCEMHQPLAGIIAFPYIDMNYTILDLLNDATKKET